MRVLVTGSAGHLGEALVRTLKDLQYDVVGLDVLASPFTTKVGSITDRSFIKSCMKGVQVVYHIATLHKPHIETHSQQQYVDTNITGTLNLLQEATEAGVESFIFTSTTSVFGDALIPPEGAPAAWITEEVVPVPKNIYGVTKAAAENLCQLYYRNNDLPCIVLRTSRFFPEEDDNPERRSAYSNQNLKVNEFLHRRVDIEDIVSAQLLAAKKAQEIGFRKYIISATTPFRQSDLSDLRINAPAVVKKLFPAYEAEYERRGWKMFPSVDRVYDNQLARTELGWQPKYDFKFIIEDLKAGGQGKSALTDVIGSKGYHAKVLPL